jgi:excisionase family DNA binding protein
MAHGAWAYVVSEGPGGVMTDRDRAQPLIDPPAVARRLEVNDRHVRRLVSERRIPFVKWGHLLRFDPLAIEAWLEEHRQAPLPPA